MGLARVNYRDPSRPAYYDYRIAGIGEALAEIVCEPDESARAEAANVIMKFLYPNADVQVLTRTRELISEILGDWTKNQREGGEG